MGEIYRYSEINSVSSSLNPMEDVLSWVEGLTSAKYVEDLLASKHGIKKGVDIRKRSEDVAKLVYFACKYLEQATKGPKEVSFLPIYYACLNLSKAYIVIGPYSEQLSTNRWHGASYNPNRDFECLDDDYIELMPNGTIPLFYLTVVGEEIFKNIAPPLTLYMRDVYPYICDISAEYDMATGNKPRLIEFEIRRDYKDDKQRIVATCMYPGECDFDKIGVGTLQAFRGLHKETPGSNTLASEWYSEDDEASIRECVRPSLLYSRCVRTTEEPFNFVPSSSGDILLPEELPLILAFFHMSNIVRYNPDGMKKLMDSKCWPMLLCLRNHGLYRLLLLFWSFVNQCSMHILRD